MTVKELIEQLEKQNPEAKIQTITVGNMNEWQYTDSPKILQSKNMFGEVVWIQ